MMDEQTFDFSLEIEGFDLELRAHYTLYPGDPGVLFGPPENCRPPEPAEIEIFKLEVESSGNYDITNLLLVDKFREMVENKIWDYLNNLDSLEEAL